MKSSAAMVRLSLVFSLASCGSEPPDGSVAAPVADSPALDTTAKPINGEVVVDSSCTDYERFRIEEATLEALEGKNGLYSLELRECLRDAVFSTEPWVSPEAVLSALGQNMPTKVKCEDDTKVGCGGCDPLKEKCNGWNACSDVATSGELFSFAKKVLNNPYVSVRYLASVFLHEVVHNKGFTHIDGLEYEYSANLHVMNCFRKDDPWFLPPNALQFRRSKMPEETTLAPIGLGGGYPFQSACAGNELVRQLNVTSGAVGTHTIVRSLAPVCSDYSSGSNPTSLWDNTLPAVGTPTTSASSLWCTTSEVATGIWGKAGDMIDKIGLRCSNAAAVFNGMVVTPRSTMLTGGQNGAYFRRDCPAGMAIREIRGRSALGIDRLQVVCASATQVRNGTALAPYSKVAPVFGTAVNVELDAEVGGQAKKYRLDYEYTCVGRSAMVGLFGRDGWEIDRLGGICQKRAAVGSFGLDATNPREHISPATIGLGGTAFEDRCPSNMALAGINVRVRDGRVAQVQGVCWDASKHSDPKGVVTATDTALLPARGVPTPSDTVFSYMCPQKGKFLYGFETWSGKNTYWDTYTVHGLRPICR